MSWRDAPSLINRGTSRCMICQEVIYDDEPSEYWSDQWEEGNIHSECIDQELKDKYPDWG